MKMSGSKLQQFTNLFMQLGDAAIFINEDQKIELINNYLSKLVSQLPQIFLNFLSTRDQSHELLISYGCYSKSQTENFS